MRFINVLLTYLLYLLSVPHLMCWRTERTFNTARCCCGVFVIPAPYTKLQTYLLTYFGQQEDVKPRSLAEGRTARSQNARDGAELSRLGRCGWWRRWRRPGRGRRCRPSDLAVSSPRWCTHGQHASHELAPDRPARRWRSSTAVFDTPDPRTDNNTQLETSRLIH